MNVENRSVSSHVPREVRDRKPVAVSRKLDVHLLPVVVLPVREEEAPRKTTKIASPLFCLAHPYYREQLVKAIESGVFQQLPAEQRQVLGMRFLRKDRVVPTQREVASRIKKKVSTVVSLERKGLTKLGIATKRQEIYRSFVVEGRGAGVLEKLPEKIRIALGIKYLGEKDVLRDEQIATKLGRSRNAVQKQIIVGLMMIGERLGKYGLGVQESRKEERIRTQRKVVRIAYEIGFFDILTPTERKILKMRGFLSPRGTLNDDWNGIAKEIGISVNTVKTLGSKAVEKLEQALRENIPQKIVVEMFVDKGFGIREIARAYGMSTRETEHILRGVLRGAVRKIIDPRRKRQAG